MSISVNTRQAYSEVDEFIELLSENEKNEIPKKLREFFKEEKDLDYKKNINASIPIKDQNLKEETLAIIALLNLQYWCKDEAEKNRLKSIYMANEEKYQVELREKYNPDNIFKKKAENIEENAEENINQENVQMIEYKEPFFKKIINKLLSIFHKN